MKTTSAWVALGASLVISACSADGTPSSAALGTAGASGTGLSGAPAVGAGTGAGAMVPAAGAVGFAGRAAGAAGTSASAAGSAAVAGRSAAGAPAAGGGGAVSPPAAGASAGAGGASAGAPAAGGGGAAAAGGGAPAAGSTAMPPAEKFSFFVTSLSGMLELSKSPMGFGGDFRFGEQTGLAGADKICTQLAEKSMPGSGAKTWRAFLSTAKGGEGGGPIHARDRIGEGPWYDRLGRLVASNLSALMMNRPMDADMAIKNDLPNEAGVPNHTDTMQGMDDNHDTVTGSNAHGMFEGNTCGDWTSHELPMGQRGPSVGHSWPSQQSGVSWAKAHVAPGCAPSVSLVQTGAGSGTGIGNAGGYGGIYCFALTP
jgi:hypothetical protein